MSYFAEGVFDIIAKTVKDAENICLRAIDYFEDAIVKDKEVHLVHDYRNYYEGEIHQFLDDIANSVESGEGKFDGDCGRRWGFRFIDGKWEEVATMTFYSDNDIIKYLMDKGYKISIAECVKS